MRLGVQRPFHSAIAVSGQAVRRYLLLQPLTNRICVLSAAIHRPKQAREIIRDRLHTQPLFDDAVVADACEALHVAPADFPRDPLPAPSCSSPEPWRRYTC